MRLANGRSGEGFIAVSAAARRKFWLDRAKTAAIAKHTNAFKINEDVVIPLERLGEYTDAIERINIELSIQNKLELVEALAARLSSDGAERAFEERRSSGAAMRSPCSRASARAGATCSAPWTSRSSARCRGSGPLGVSPPAGRRRNRIRAAAGSQHPRELEIRAARRRSRRSSAARRSRRSSPSATRLHRRVLQGRMFVALHMHAGDGNVHTNIPVNSDNYAMLQYRHPRRWRGSCASRAQLNGVISGEHGIGITKLEHLTADELAAVVRVQAAASIRTTVSIR